MKKAIITCSNSTIELYEFVEAFYLVSQKANTALELLRKGLPTWVSPEKYDEMKISLWVYNDTRANALCHYENGENYIALSVGLLIAFWNEVEDFVSQDNLTSAFKISEENRPTFMDNIYFYMLKVGDVRSIYYSTTGMWWEMRYRSIVETIANLVLNVVLGYYFGINGIILATVISLFLFNFL